MGQCHHVMLVSTKENCAKPFMKSQVCPNFITAILENNQLLKSGANSNFYNVAMKSLPLSLRIFIWIFPFCFVVKNSHLKLQCVCMFPLAIPVKNIISTVSCDKALLILKSN